MRKVWFFVFFVFLALVVPRRDVLAGCGQFFVDEGNGDVSNAITLHLLNCDYAFGNYYVEVGNDSGEKRTVALIPITELEATWTFPPNTFAFEGEYYADLYETNNQGLTSKISRMRFSLTDDDGPEEETQGPVNPNDTSEVVSEGCDNTNYVNTAIGCIPFNDTNSAARFFLGWGLGIAGGIALLTIGFASIVIATSQGDPRRLEGGKTLLLSAIGGLLMIALSVFILRTVSADILRIF